MKSQILFTIFLGSVCCILVDLTIDTSSPWHDEPGVGYAKALVKGKWGRICVDDISDKSWANVFCKEYGRVGVSTLTRRNLRTETGLTTLKNMRVTMHNPQCPPDGPWSACTQGPRCQTKGKKKAVYIYCRGVWTREWDEY